MHAMKDTMGIIQYAVPAWFWVCGNKEQKKNKIIKALIEAVNKLISLEDFNPVAILHDPN